MFQEQAPSCVPALNFVAFTKPNKHNYNLAEFVFEYSCDSRRILASFDFFFLKSLFATCPYCYLNPKRVIQSTLKLPSLCRVFAHITSLQNHFPALSYHHGVSLKPNRYKRQFCFRVEIGRLRARKETNEPWEGFVKI